MTEKIQLSASIRSNLLTLTRTNELADRTQGRLASGLKVSSALDNAAAFFAARALSFRADDLGRLKDNIDQSISAIQAAINGIEAITSLIEQSQGIAITAKATGDTNERSSLGVQFDALLSQIDSLTNDASFQGQNLISAAPDNLVVDFNEDATSQLTIAGIDSSTASTGINVAAASNDFVADTDIDIAIRATRAALTTLRTSSAVLGSNNSVLQTRLDFTEDLINTLEEGAGKLTLADLNEESANLLSLQTRQQLGLNSLALAAQSERSILNLFG
jgi:flagellin-like hook-associated protein FlgL